MEAKYVLGFLIDEFNNVALVRKKKGPGNQKGKLNGFGGHLKNLEGPLEGMQREFIDESGWPGSPGWYPMPPMEGNDWIVYCFWTQHNFIYPFNGCEDVEIHKLNDIKGATVKNVLNWLRKVKEAIDLLTYIKSR